MNDLRFRNSWFIGGLVLVAFVIVACLLPAPVIAPVASFLPDKVEHAGAYVGMSLWFSALIARRDWWKLALALAILGGAIEIAQGVFTTTRECDIMDELANCGGIIVGLAIAAAGGHRWAALAERIAGLKAR